MENKINKKCKIKIERNIFGLVKEVKTSGNCTKEQVEATLKKRDFSIRASVLAL